MCGIVAIYRRNGAPVAAEEVVAMRDLLAHRGPDDHGLWLGESVGLGHRRLQVIDLEGGRQPMASFSGSAHLVYNGEIYNYRELRRLLLDRGVTLRTESDTETILGLYELFGLDLVDHLRGMFAFVLWDATRRRLLAARDRMGIKPLYVYDAGGTVALASEMKALTALEGFRPQAALRHVGEYLVFRRLEGEETLLEGVRRVAPGELLLFDQARTRRHRYWRPPDPSSAPQASASIADWQDELAALLRQVVREHLVSDVPVGTFNSGGLDSSLVTALVAGDRTAELNTYSVGFDDPAFDESRHAQAVADRFSTRHHRLVVPETDYGEWLTRAIWHHDEPLNHPHSVHLLFLSRLARERVTVVLTGEGSDELFAGYTRYRLPWLLDRCPPLATWLRPVVKLGATLLPPRPRLRVKALLPAGAAIDLKALTAFGDPGLARRLLPDPGLWNGVPRSSPGGDRPPQLLARALLGDQLGYLQSLLNRLDKMSMAASLEGRVPFLDHRLVELAARVPPQLKIRRFETKYLLKATARTDLPPSVIQRRKAGFSVPVTSWLRPGGALAPYVDCLLEPRSRDRGYCEPAELTRLIDQHRAGSHDHGELLWGLVNLELWHRVLLEERRPPSVDVGAARP